MKKLLYAAAIITCVTPLLLGCATTADKQRQALEHQQRADQAAKRGSYKVAGEEQRKAADAHHEAVKQALDQGKPIPPQPEVGDTPLGPEPTE